MKRAFVAITGVFVLMTIALLWERNAQQQVDRAKAVYNVLIVKLEQEKSVRGHYPRLIDEAWLPSESSDLIRARDFYVPSADGEAFLLRFQDPRIDPRFWFRDVCGYDSREGVWRQYDGY